MNYTKASFIPLSKLEDMNSRRRKKAMRFFCEHRRDYRVNVASCMIEALPKFLLHHPGFMQNIKEVPEEWGNSKKF